MLALLLRSVFLVAVALLSAPNVRAAEPFYKGKRLTLLIGASSGGPTDIEGRLLAKYLGRHIDGQPAVLVQNKDGAGGVVGATFLGEVAPRDGSMLGYFSGTAWNSSVSRSAGGSICAASSSWRSSPAPPSISCAPMWRPA